METPDYAWLESFSQTRVSTLIMQASESTLKTYESIWKHTKNTAESNLSQSPKKTIQETSIDPKSASRCVLNLTFWTKLSTFDRFLQKVVIVSIRRLLNIEDTAYFGMRQSPWALGGAQVAPFGGKTPGFVSIPRPWPRRTRAQRVSWLNCNDRGPTQGGEPPGGQPWPA